jgi:glycosyltransferase involved in cell wall biosynthesis
MKIGIEAERANLPNPTGVERYAAELIKNFARMDSRNEYVLYFRTKPQQWFYELPKNFSIKVMPFPKFWTQIRISWEMLIHPVDLLFIPASALPFWHPKKSIATVHDVAWRIYPGAFTKIMRRYLEWSTKLAIKSAAKVITVSEATKKDLEKFYGVPAEKVAVTYLGMNSTDYRPMTYEQVQPVLDKHGLVYQKYILFVGTMQPRKNIVRLVEAFEKLRKENRIEEKLAIFGGKGWLWEPILEKIETAGKDGSIKYFSYAPQEDLPYLYAGAKLLTLPALYEGFGLPPLEAMASGTPVVVSNISSLPEVVGDAGKLIEPTSVDSIAAGLLDVLTNPELRESMVKKGIEQSKKFTWENTAKETLNIFESLK